MDVTDGFPATGSTALVVEQLSHWYGTTGTGVHALADINVSLPSEEFLCIVGPSGCGKSTLLQLIAGFSSPSVGRIEVDGEVVKGPSARRGVVFQQPNLFPWLNVAENVGFGPRVQGVRRGEARKRVAALLELVDLTDFADSAPYTLSGGMQQRAAIARALANEPDLLLMDEPFGALDAMTRHRMQEALQEIWRRTRSTIVFITHDVEEAVFLGTRVIVMGPRPGRCVATVVVPGHFKDAGADLWEKEEFHALVSQVRGMITGVSSKADI